MKNIIKTLLILFMLFSIVGCKKNDNDNEQNNNQNQQQQQQQQQPNIELTLEESSISLYVGDTYEIKPILKNFEGNVNYIVEINDKNILSNEGLVIEALTAGVTQVKISIEDQPNISTTLNVTVEQLIPIIAVFWTDTQIYVGDTLPITIEVYGASLEDVVIYILDETIVDENLVALKAGTTSIDIYIPGFEEYKKTVEIVVIEPFVPVLNVDKTNIELDEDDSTSVNINSNIDYEISISNTNISYTKEIGSNVLIINAISSGETILKVYSTEYNIECIINITINEVIIDTTSPEILLNNVLQNVTIKWGEEFDPLKGISAIDDIDGDITDKISVDNPLDNKSYGTYEIKYEVKDNAGNTASITRNVEVIWGHDVQFIGHRGCYYGVDNSEEAFVYAASVLKYQALECDIKQTKDGVFVICHDDTFGGKTLSNCNYDEIKDIVVTKTRNAGYPKQYGEVPGNGTYSATIITLERFLEICKQYNVNPVIELKSSKGISNSDQSRMQALMDVIEKCGMLEEVIFLGSAYNCLIWVKQNGYSYIPCQYLVNSCDSETVYNRCVTYGLDLSINATGDTVNSPEWIARYKDAGLKVSAWTFTQYVDYDETQRWIDMGIDYITTDWHRMDKLTLPDLSNTEQHTVKYYDIDGSLIKETKIYHNHPAPLIPSPSKEGYEFLGWSESLSKVTKDLDVYAEYDVIEYSITYNNNLYKITKSSFANKDEFVNEFYSDLFNWLKNAASYDSQISISNDVIKVSLNGQTASFSTVEELLAVDISVFEKTIGNKFYKPVEGTNSASYVPTVSNDYFLNTEPYRTKYIEMNAYLLNCIKVSYPKYDQNFNPNSSGKVQITYRFHQWVKGTNIASLNTLPNKYIFKYATNIESTMPTTHLTYTIEDEFELPNPVASIEFLGWYLNSEATSEQITKIEKGTTGDIILYAKWEEYTIPDVYSNITYELNGGTNSTNNKSQYLEGVSTVLSPATKLGYVFLGWTLEENSTSYLASIKETFTGDITLYAQYELEKYSVTYNLQGGEWGNEVVYNGSCVSKISSTSNTGYWTGYLTNIYLFTASSYISKLNATWSFRVSIALDESVGTYVVKKISDSGESFDPSGSDYILQISSSHSNYSGMSSFMKSVVIGQVVRFIGDPNSGAATIEFYNKEDVSGGLIENFISEFTIEDFNALLPTPKYEGKTFVGWSTSNSASDIISQIPEGTYNNLVLYAIWE